MQLGYRHVQLGFLRILQVQELGFAFAEIHADQTHVATDAVVHMHDRIADFQLRQIAHHEFDLRGRFLLALADASTGTGIKFGFGNECKCTVIRIQLEAVMQRCYAEYHFGCCSPKIGKTVA